MNILFITADQWRGRCLSRLDHPVVKTPHLDSLAADGVLFSNHFAQAAPCAPSRTSLHTGMYLQNHRCVLNGTPIDNRFTNWAIEISKKGYSPSLFGYTDSALDPRGIDPADKRLTHYSEPLQGIETFTPIQGEVSVLWVDHLKSKGYSVPEKVWELYGRTQPGTEWEAGGTVPLPLAFEAKDHETHVMVDACMQWIGTQNAPWITHLSLLRPHPPFVAPEPYNTMYPPDQVDDLIRQPSIAIESAQHPYLDYQLNHNQHGISVGEGYRAADNKKETLRKKASYYGLMTEVDDNLGRLFDYLKETDQWSDTLIIFTSDHGEQMGDHWLMSKSGYFDQSYHVPLIVRDPRPAGDQQRGKVVDVFTENIDIMPTMLDYLGLDIPGQCDGRSLIPFLQRAEKVPGWRQEVHWEYDFRNILNTTPEQQLGLSSHQCTLNVIRDNHYKYVHFTALPPLFFDLTQDPHEFVNRANDPDYQSLVLRYAQKMISWRMNHDERALTEIFLSKSGPITRAAPLQPIMPW